MKGKKTGGRRRGTPNLATIEIRTFTRDLFSRPKVQARIIRMAEAGKLAPAVFVAFLQYAYGKPVEKLELGGRVRVSPGKVMSDAAGWRARRVMRPQATFPPPSVPWVRSTTVPKRLQSDKTVRPSPVRRPCRVACDDLGKLHFVV
jgi:hypothetical protein